jgi:hypothetical protein
MDKLKMGFEEFGGRLFFAAWWLWRRWWWRS